MNWRCKGWWVACLLLILLGVLSACSIIGSEKPPTPIPTEYLPTILALTLEAGQAELLASLSASPTPPQTEPTLAPSLTPMVTASTPSPTSSEASLSTRTESTASPTARTTKTPTPSPTPGIPTAAVLIHDPGPMSKIVSPLALTASVNTISGGSLRIELWLEPLQADGEARLLLRDLRTFGNNPLDRIYLDEELVFELGRLSEFAQLRISTYDSYQRPVEAASVDLLLLSVGENDFNPSGDPSQAIVIHEPTENKLIQGGVVIVSGLVRPAGNGNFLIELITQDGKVVGYRQVFVTPDPDGKHVPFIAEVPYDVAEPTWVRLVMHENASRIPGITQLSSVEILLSP